MRDRYDEIKALGAEVVAVGTGNERYAAAFVRDERIPFTVLVDDEGAAASAAQVKVVSFLALFTPGTWKATRDTMKRGYRIHKAGARVNQMGGTWVIAPGNRVVYAHPDLDSTHHAPLDSVLDALRGAPGPSA